MTTKTVGELYDPLAHIYDEEEAFRYLDELVDYYMDLDYSQTTARKMVANNASYYAGYFGDRTAQRIRGYVAYWNVGGGE